MTGTIAPDPDGNGTLKYLAARNTYDRGLLTKVESGQLNAWLNDTVAPASWEGQTTFTKYLIKEMDYDSYGRLSVERVRSGILMRSSHLCSTRTTRTVAFSVRRCA